jgi:hypothetical protein
LYAQRPRIGKSQAWRGHRGWRARSAMAALSALLALSWCALRAQDGFFSDWFERSDQLIPNERVQLLFKLPPYLVHHRHL